MRIGIVRKEFIIDDDEVLDVVDFVGDGGGSRVV